MIFSRITIPTPQTKKALLGALYLFNTWQVAVAKQLGHRLIVVNRLPLTLRKVYGHLVAERSAGGLTSAMDPLLRSSGGIWIGLGWRTNSRQCWKRCLPKQNSGPSGGKRPWRSSPCGRTKARHSIAC